MTTSSSLADVAVGALTDDPYLDATTGTLRNLLGIQERSELARAEIDLVFRRAATRRSPANPTYDLAHLQAIHQWLFQDVFEWAGNLRRRDIRKGENEFWPANLLKTRTERVLSGLQQGPLLERGVGDATFLDTIATLYLDLNHLHPFREGNGRTQRAFLNDVAAASGRVIDCGRVSRSANDAASSRAVQSQGSSLDRVDLG